MSLRTLVFAAVVAAVMVGCSDPPDPTLEGATRSPASPQPVDASPTSSPVPTADLGAATEAVGERVEVTVVEGQVEGPGTVTVDAGTKLQVVVTSDVADEVHVHGYDLSESVAAGETVTLLFTADIPGAFEVELEGSGTHLFELQVRG